ncbi:hypothetical protein [Nannocystis punicea]|uniref:ClpX C4-type zinc finger n=1 Tax=Nannocystis punicea TaxID=2995304 RepID=A0ABY7H9S1_9BACT|nr:hypothetical protein [Nannocystis poenicansa]WAS96021.1 hypothetical protein O0S08_07630 [Nannocystis poenicansa]
MSTTGRAVTMDREAARSWMSQCGYLGWLGLVDLVYDRLPPGLRIKQVYQKWAELRFDLDPEDEAFEAFLTEIAEWSATICSVCGGPGRNQLVDDREETICDACHALAVSRTDP